MYKPIKFNLLCWVCFVLLLGCAAAARAGDDEFYYIIEPDNFILIKSSDAAIGGNFVEVGSKRLRNLDKDELLAALKNTPEQALTTVLENQMVSNGYLSYAGIDNNHNLHFKQGMIAYIVSLGDDNVGEFTFDFNDHLFVLRVQATTSRIQASILNLKKYPSGGLK